VSKKINTTSIGLFIVTGLALGVIALLLFSSSKWFTKTREMIVYFDETLNGLNEGAPVKYRGVTIGSVKRVMVHFNQDDDDYAMPVIIELQEDLIRERMGEGRDVLTTKGLDEWIKAGMRATLETESLVTGVLYIECRPNPSALPPVFHQKTKIYPEVPSEPTQMNQLFHNLASLDLKSIQTNLNMLITRLDTTVGDLKLAEVSRRLTNLLTSVDRIVSSPDITNGLAALRPTLDQYRDLGAKLTSRVDPVANGLTNSLAEATRALSQIQGTGENLRSLLAPDSALRTQLEQALEQLAAASQSMAALADFLKQHPNALITGRETPKPEHE
jgi:paraquat-inducible protein B